MADAIVTFNVSSWTDKQLTDAARFWQLNELELAKIWQEMKYRQWWRELENAFTFEETMS